MCQTRTISYICQHTCSFRLSKCRGTFTHVKHRTREERASCAGYALFTNYSKSECGSCSKETVERKLSEKIAALSLDLNTDDWAAEEPEELTKAREDRDRQLYMIDRLFPDGRFKKMARPEQGLSRTRTSDRTRSKLRTEVMPEDVVASAIPKVTWSTCGWDEGWADSSEGWARLEDEIAEDRAAQEVAGITVSWEPWSGLEDPGEETYQACNTDGELVRSAQSKLSENLVAHEGEKRALDVGQNIRSGIDERVEHASGKQNPFRTLDTVLMVH